MESFEDSFLRQTDYLVERLAESKEDSFGYQTLAKSLASTLQNASPPFVFSICGAWGSGKSTFLRYLVRNLPNPKNGGLVLYFNAWRSSVNSDIRAAFVWEIAQQLQSHSRTFNLDIKNSLDLIKESAIDAFAEGGVWANFLSGVIKRSISHEELCFDAELKAQKKIREGFDKLAGKLSRQRIITFVLIDEIDRCAPEQVVAILEALRMFVVGPDELEHQVYRHNGLSSKSVDYPFRFILSMDEDYVNWAFANRYNLGVDEAANYTSKFIQFKYHFPNKKWGRFIKGAVKKYGAPEFFPYLGRDLTKVFAAFNINSPRNAYRCLAYLFFWQNRIYGSLSAEGSKSSGLASIIVADCHKADRAESINGAINFLNFFMITWAAIKIIFPSEVGRLVEKGIISRLPQTESISPSLLFDKSMYERLPANRQEKIDVLINSLNRVQTAFQSLLKKRMAGKEAARIVNILSKCLSKAFKS